MNTVLRLFGIALIFFLGRNNSAGNTCFPDQNQEEIKSSADSVPIKKVSCNVKLNPIQAVFCEIPVSVEFFGANRSSFQMQIGYIFPRYNAFLQQLMEMQGEEAMATNEGIFSYRTSPYNNYGISGKIEFRKYEKRIYYAFQMMLKYCYYDKLTYALHNGGMAYNQTESKDSYIFGIGLMRGRQSEESRVIIDRYFGVGLRFRSMNIIVHEIDPLSGPLKSVYPDKKEYITSFYPFVNLGLRVGYKFGNK